MTMISDKNNVSSSLSGQVAPPKQNISKIDQKANRVASILMSLNSKGLSQSEFLSYSTWYKNMYGEMALEIMLDETIAEAKKKQYSKASKIAQDVLDARTDRKLQSLTQEARDIDAPKFEVPKVEEKINPIISRFESMAEDNSQIATDPFDMSTFSSALTDRVLDLTKTGEVDPANAVLIMQKIREINLPDGHQLHLDVQALLINSAELSISQVETVIDNISMEVKAMPADQGIVPVIEIAEQPVAESLVQKPINGRPADVIPLVRPAEKVPEFSKTKEEPVYIEPETLADINHLNKSDSVVESSEYTIAQKSKTETEKVIDELVDQGEISVDQAELLRNKLDLIQPSNPDQLVEQIKADPVQAIEPESDVQLDTGLDFGGEQGFVDPEAVFFLQDKFQTEQALTSSISDIQAMQPKVFEHEQTEINSTAEKVIDELVDQGEISVDQAELLRNKLDLIQPSNPDQLVEQIKADPVQAIEPESDVQLDTGLDFGGEQGFVDPEAMMTMIQSHKVKDTNDLEPEQQTKANVEQSINDLVDSGVISIDQAELLKNKLEHLTPEMVGQEVQELRDDKISEDRVDVEQELGNDFIQIGPEINLVQNESTVSDIDIEPVPEQKAEIREAFAARISELVDTGELSAEDAEKLLEKIDTYRVPEQVTTQESVELVVDVIQSSDSNQIEYLLDSLGQSVELENGNELVNSFGSEGGFIDTAEIKDLIKPEKDTIQVGQLKKTIESLEDRLDELVQAGELEPETALDLKNQIRDLELGRLAQVDEMDLKGFEYRASRSDENDIEEFIHSINTFPLPEKDKRTFGDEAGFISYGQIADSIDALDKKLDELIQADLITVSDAVEIDAKITNSPIESIEKLTVPLMALQEIEPKSENKDIIDDNISVIKDIDTSLELVEDEHVFNEAGFVDFFEKFGDISDNEIRPDHQDEPLSSSYNPTAIEIPRVDAEIEQIITEREERAASMNLQSTRSGGLSGEEKVQSNNNAAADVQSATQLQDKMNELATDIPTAYEEAQEVARKLLAASVPASFVQQDQVQRTQTQQATQSFNQQVAQLSNTQNEVQAQELKIIEERSSQSAAKKFNDFTIANQQPVQQPVNQQSVNQQPVQQQPVQQQPVQQQPVQQPVNQQPVQQPEIKASQVKSDDFGIKVEQKSEVSDRGRNEPDPDNKIVKAITPCGAKDVACSGMCATCGLNGASARDQIQQSTEVNVQLSIKSKSL